MVKLKEVRWRFQVLVLPAHVEMFLKPQESLLEACQETKLSGAARAHCQANVKGNIELKKKTGALPVCTAAFQCKDCLCAFSQQLAASTVFQTGDFGIEPYVSIESIPLHHPFFFVCTMKDLQQISCRRI
jgi:hypothetical protein